MALDLKTGAVRWATEALPYDAWTVACIPFLGDGSNCPDAGRAGLRLRAGTRVVHREAGGEREATGPRRRRPEERPVLGARPRHRRRGVGDAGRARRDRRRPPVGLGRRRHSGCTRRTPTSTTQPWPVVPPDATTGVWSGLDAVTGAVLWQTRPPHGGSTSGPATTANGVVFGCTIDAASARATCTR